MSVDLLFNLLSSESLISSFIFWVQNLWSPLWSLEFRNFDLLSSGRGGEPRRVKQMQSSWGERTSAHNGVAHATAPDARRQADQQEAADEEEDEGDEEEEGQHEEVSARGNDHLRIPNRRRSSIQL